MYSNAKLTHENGIYILRADSKRFGKNEIIFQSPLESDLDRFLDENKLIVEFEDCGEEYDDLRGIDGKELLGYWRMYFRGGWCGTWFPESNNKLSNLEIKGLDNIIFYISKKWDRGCDYFMQDDVNTSFETWGSEHRFLVKPRGVNNYLVMIDTTYGNGDYPCRIYVYREKERKENE